MAAWRYKCRKLGDTEWQVISIGVASDTVAEAVVANWNKCDRNIREWTYEECLPTDDDYPAVVPNNAR
jgi:hypothetical protein